MAVASTVVDIGKVLYATILKFEEQYKEMQHSNEICRTTLEKLQILRSIIEVLQTQKSYVKADPRVKDVVKKIEKKFEEYEKKFFNRSEKNGLLHPRKQSNGK